MKKQRVVLLNLLIATAISLIVNFSYFVFSVMSSGQTEAMGRRMPVHTVPEMHNFVALQVVYFMLFAFVLLSILTYKKGVTGSDFVRRLVYCIVVAVVFYFFTPTTNREGECMLLCSSNRLFNPMLVLKVSFTLIVSVMYGKIFELLYQRQQIVVENELLKNENLKAQYNTLMQQINPHFLFNSLNSLSMLVRQNQTQRAITYIDQLSHTFRYVIQNSENGVAMLKDEIDFVQAYKYLLEIRYADKLFIDIQIPPQFYPYTLPSLSLQPLIENAVNHNTITSAHPFHVRVEVVDGWLEVSNPRIARLTPHEGTGIGLKNLSSRYKLLTGKDIEVVETDTEFRVRLPLNI